MSFCAKEVIEVVKSTTELSGVHDEIAFVEQGIEFFVEQCVKVGGSE
jgi:hypothetical protein